MTRRHWSLALFAVVCLTPKLSSQVVDATNCVYREGDDPRWASADYDDSGWEKAPPDLVYQRPRSRFLWQRCRVDAPQTSEPLFLQVRSAHAWQAYVDGIPAGSFGNPNTGSATREMTQRRALPSALGRKPSWAVAIRFTNGNDVWVASRPTVGTAPGLELRRLRKIREGLSAIWVPSAAGPLILGAALVLLLLSRADPRRRAAFWFGVNAGSFAFVRIVDAISVLEMPLDTRLHLLLLLVGYSGLVILVLQCYALQEKPVPRIIRTLVVAAIVSDVFLYFPLVLGEQTFLLFAWLGASAPAHMFGLVLRFVVTAAAATAFWPWRGLNRRDLPLFVASMLWMIVVCTVLVVQMPWIGNPSRLVQARQAITAVILPSILGFTVILASRFRRVHVEHDDLTSEMRGARAVQEMLVPESVPSLSGFVLAAAYLPSREVSGDFYQLLPAADGSLLVVVGDVSGKGLEAAMVGAAVVGSLGALTSRRPAKVLADLNRALHGKTRGGFVTCGCALFHADGSVELANAGHILPYLGGLEVEVSSGFPLGMVEEAEYDTTILNAEAGMMTFVSDGVVEAANAKGELFGFERTREISGKSAQQIANAAKAWGQNDDITVVTVRRSKSGDAGSVK